MTPHGIAARLTADGIKSPGGKDKWNAGAVRSILTNEKYKGDALLRKELYGGFPHQEEKGQRGRNPAVLCGGNHEAIIQPEVFELVQQELKRRKQGRGPHSGVHLFSGKIRCGQCGEWYGSKVWHSNSKYRRVIWQCNHKYDGEEKCSTPHLTEDEIKAMFISAANKLIGKKTAIISPLRASLDIAFDTSALEAESRKIAGRTHGQPQTSSRNASTKTLMWRSTRGNTRNAMTVLPPASTLQKHGLRKSKPPLLIRNPDGRRLNPFWARWRKLT
ncbi:MAG: recombinase family protein [Coprococcus sp.]